MRPFHCLQSTGCGSTEKHCKPFVELAMTGKGPLLCAFILNEETDAQVDISSMLVVRDL